MKSFIAIAVLCAVIYLASGTPVPAEFEEAAQMYDPALFESAAVAEEAPLLRQKRATCDLLSGFGVGDSACALHCIGHGKRGGYCERGTCYCR